MTGDVGDTFNALKAYRRERGAKYGVNCPECVRLLPKACPSILLPGKRCKIHGYVDRRPPIPDEEQT